MLLCASIKLLQAKRYLSPKQHRIAIEKFNHVGFDLSRPVVAEDNSRHNGVAASLKATAIADCRGRYQPEME